MDTSSSIHEVIATLLDLEHPFPTKYIYALSRLDPEDVQILKAAWKTIPIVRRKALLEDMAEFAEDDYTLVFEPVGKIGLYDDEDDVIVRAIDLLFNSEDIKLAGKFISLLSLEEHGELVRAAAANALGPYVYYGELEELSEEVLTRVVSALLVATRKDPSDLVQRRALEALGYSSNEVVPALIRQAADRGDLRWLESALFAMGRSATQEWKPYILENLTHDELSVQMQAVHAAGEVYLKEARSTLVKIIKQPHQDEELRKEAIWALGQIGGKGTVDFLEELLEKTDDDDESELIEEAIDNANMTNQISSLDLMKIELDEDGEPIIPEFDEDQLEDDDVEEFEAAWREYIDEDEDDEDEDDDDDSIEFDDPLEFGDEDDGF